ncbi:MAG TPA: endonuclease/exonuclease/phosphatase family protein [Bacteroidales bacterium]|nr:endonuclease/exonuclease/phosphatase family protein [Bacteroidales bacterium]HON20523.1 endonuclease/exonuclease/phosphatase family protein [Bacteroidales bacterium]HOR81162.1 endonuclease/exonuclease/phosphatase family protein [Bacteroidales bacterium]HPJ90716.1 endonuclease/exonuclease/phosphatase family protein [Bacteroidales bacterium]HQB20582.1 endonuclease/exonuclease/phosphatase family protein [Bacteroidales bacterium]
MVKKRKRNLLNFIFIVLNIVFAILLLLSYLANYISPEKYFFIAFMGLSYPYLLLANTLFLFYWIIQLHRFFLLSLICIAIGFSFIPRLYQFKKKEVEQQDSTSIKIMSYNVNIFGLYNSKNTSDSIFNYIQKEKPNIICFQEYFQNNKHYKYDDTIINKTKAKYKHLYIKGKSHQFGLATFSVFPIINKGIIILPKATTNKAMFTDIAIKQDTIRVYNIHFQSIKFEETDYHFTEKVTNIDIDIKNKRTQKEAKQVFKKLKKGYLARSKQVQTIVEHIKNSPYPVVVCGDFNDVPWSYTYQKISNLLSDAFVDSGKGFAPSFYVNQRLPIRIDYVFYDKRFYEVTNFKVDKKPYSDHFPVQTLLSKVKI